jgi:hypothetical protein
MRASSHSPPHSWRSSGANAFLTARRSPAFSLRSIKQRLRRCVPCFSKIWSPDRWRRRKGWEGYGIDREITGSSSMWMAHGKRPANVPCHPPLIFLRPSAVWTRCVLQGISDASGVKPSAPGRPCSRRIRINGSARFQGHRARATASIEENCGRR